MSNDNARGGRRRVTESMDITMSIYVLPLERFVRMSDSWRSVYNSYIALNTSLTSFISHCVHSQTGLDSYLKLKDKLELYSNSKILTFTVRRKWPNLNH